MISSQSRYDHFDTSPCSSFRGGNRIACLFIVKIRNALVKCFEDNWVPSHEYYEICGGEIVPLGHSQTYNTKKIQL